MNIAQCIEPKVCLDALLNDRQWEVLGRKVYNSLRTYRKDAVSYQRDKNVYAFTIMTHDSDDDRTAVLNLIRFFALLYGLLELKPLRQIDATSTRLVFRTQRT